MMKMLPNKDKSWSLSKGDGPVVSDNFVDTPLNDSTKLTVQLKIDEGTSGSSMHGWDG